MELKTAEEVVEGWGGGGVVGDFVDVDGLVVGCCGEVFVVVEDGLDGVFFVGLEGGYCGTCGGVGEDDVSGHGGRDEPFVAQDGDGEDCGGVEVGVGAEEGAVEGVEAEGAVSGGGYEEGLVEGGGEVSDCDEEDVGLGGVWGGDLERGGGVYWGVVSVVIYIGGGGGGGGGEEEGRRRGGVRTGDCEFVFALDDLDLLELERQVEDALLVEDLLDGEGRGGVFGVYCGCLEVRLLEERSEGLQPPPCQSVLLSLSPIRQRGSRPCRSH